MLLVFLERIFYRIEDMLKPSVAHVSWGDKIVVEAPTGLSEVSVEMALNSRCSSDYDGNPRKFHWGMFVETKTLSAEYLGMIIDLAIIPRFTQTKISVESEDNILFFLIEDIPSGKERDWAMVESGMQQQAVGLVCSALGIGISLKGLGKDGIYVSEGEYVSVKARIDAMKPSYQGSYWSGMTPSGRQAWVTGNLPDPIRDSDNSFFSILPNVRITNKGTKLLNNKQLSQLLWAARGRTPHLYKTKPWGLTIPTWGGVQNISSVYVIRKDTLSIYCNWQKNRPTHSLNELTKISINLMYLLSDSFHQNDTFIVFNRLEHHARSSWEVGYQLFNLLMQAKAFDIGYHAALITEFERKTFQDIGILDPIAVVSL
jgi:hypothetical protein